MRAPAELPVARVGPADGVAELRGQIALDGGVAPGEHIDVGVLQDALVAKPGGALVVLFARAQECHAIAVLEVGWHLDLPAEALASLLDFADELLVLDVRDAVSIRAVDGLQEALVARVFVGGDEVLFGKGVALVLGQRRGAFVAPRVADLGLMTPNEAEI